VKILVLGASGLLGAYLGFALPREGHSVVGASRSPVSHFKDSRVCSLSGDFDAAIRADKWDLVINSVAIASHAECERDEKAAVEVNAVLPGRYARVARDVGSTFVQVSTDAVFDGLSEEPYRESDQTNPWSAYGRSKLLGEGSVMSSNPEALVLRTNFFGWSVKQETGILDHFLTSFRKGARSVGYQDYLVSSLYMGDFVSAMLGLVERGETGVFHCGSSAPLSKYDFAMAVAERAGANKASVEPGFVSDTDLVGAKARNLGLSSEKVEATLDTQMPSTLDGLDRAFDEHERVLRHFRGS